MFCFTMMFFLLCNLVEKYKMKEIINKFLLAGDKFMPEVHLRQLGFTCTPFTINKYRIQKFKKQEIQNIFTERN